MKLTSGIKNMAVDGKQICDIIRACHKSGVSWLKFGDLEVRFSQENQEMDVHECRASDASKELPESPASLIQESTAALSSGQEEMLEHARLTELSIVDPVAWENHCIDQVVHGGQSLNA